MSDGLTHACVQVHSLLELNIISTTYMTRAVLPGMLSRKKGAIVNLASAASRNPSPFLSLYSGAKSFIEVSCKRQFSNGHTVVFLLCLTTIPISVYLFSPAFLSIIRFRI